MLITKSMKKLVDVETGLFDRRIFTDLDIYQQELEQVFGRCWVGVGHESQIPNPNDFHAAYIGEDPVLVTRDAKGKIHTFLNMCRHRGNRVCRADFGNSPSFMCTYHGWTFAADGKLVGVPGYKEAYFEELDRSQWGLVEARCESYKGLVFANWDKDAPSLVDYLGNMTWYLDIILDRRAGGTELLNGVQRHVMHVNWKIPADNVAGDGYHFPITHGSLSYVGPRTKKNPIEGLYQGMENSFSVYAGNGHCPGGVYLGPTRDVEMRAAWPRVVSEYFKEHAEEFKSRMGGGVRANQNMGVGNIFPSTAFNCGHSCVIRLRNPKGPLHTEAWTYCLVDKEAPEEVKTALRHDLSLHYGASGVQENDDADNWNQVTRSGLIARAAGVSVNYQLGIGRDKRKNEQVPGLLAGPQSNEANQRAFYGFWAEVMDAPSWAEVTLSSTQVRN